MSVVSLMSGHFPAAATVRSSAIAIARAVVAAAESVDSTSSGSCSRAGTSPPMTKLKPAARSPDPPAPTTSRCEMLAPVAYEHVLAERAAQ